MVGIRMFDGFFKTLIIIGIIIFIIGCIPTFFITKSIYYNKGYEEGVKDYCNGVVKFDTIVTTKIKIIK